MNVTLVPEQIGFDPAIETLTGRIGFTVMVILFEVAGLPVGQVALEVSTQVMTSPFASAALVYVVEFVPTFVPFFFHWYEGVVPPLVGVAVNVMLVPAQIVLVPAMETLTGRFGFTVMLMVFEVAGLPVGQVALEVTTQVTAFPFARVVEVKVLEFVPTFPPFIFHW